MVSEAGVSINITLHEKDKLLGSSYAVVAYLVYHCFLRARVMVQGSRQS